MKKQLLTKLKVLGHVLWVLWTVGLGYLLMNTPITNPILCLVVYLTPIVVLRGDLVDIACQVED